MTSYKDDENSVPGEPQSPPHSFTPVVDGGASATLDNDLSSGGASDEPHDSTPGSPNFTKPSDTEDEEDSPEPPMKKRRQISSLPSDLNGASAASSPSPSTPAGETQGTPSAAKTASKSSNKSKKKKKNNPWVKTASRKGKKKGKNNSGTPTSPAQRFPDKNVDDTPEARICLSKVYKADKVELSEDRMSAGSTKGYRMVRATRGVTEGAWYFEIKVVHLGSSGHTRLGWSTDEGDLQAPVGFDRNSFGYRDIDGSKVHKAVREKYGEEGYKEGDVIGFYINLSAPESEICFFKNGQCQGTAFSDLAVGRYFPAASMYTLPDQPNCTVKFNFGPDFEFFPGDFGGRVVPRPMVEVPFHGLDDVRAENEMNS